MIRATPAYSKQKLPAPCFDAGSNEEERLFLCACSGRQHGAFDCCVLGWREGQPITNDVHPRSFVVSDGGVLRGVPSFGCYVFLFWHKLLYGKANNVTVAECPYQSNKLTQKHPQKRIYFCGCYYHVADYLPQSTVPRIIQALVCSRQPCVDAYQHAASDRIDCD